MPDHQNAKQFSTITRPGMLSSTPEVLNRGWGGLRINGKTNLMASRCMTPFLQDRTMTATTPPVFTSAVGPLTLWISRGNITMLLPPRPVCAHVKRIKHRGTRRKWEKVRCRTRNRESRRGLIRREDRARVEDYLIHQGSNCAAASTVHLQEPWIEASVLSKWVNPHWWQSFALIKTHPKEPKNKYANLSSTKIKLEWNWMQSLQHGYHLKFQKSS